MLVDDGAIRDAQWMMMRDIHTLAEGAGATALAGVLAHRDRFTGQRIAIMCTGGNASPDEIRACLLAHPAPLPL